MANEQSNAKKLGSRGYLLARRTCWTSLVLMGLLAFTVAIVVIGGDVGQQSSGGKAEPGSPVAGYAVLVIEAMLGLTLIASFFTYKFWPCPHCGRRLHYAPGLAVSPFAKRCWSCRADLRGA